LQSANGLPPRFCRNSEQSWRGLTSVFAILALLALAGVAVLPGRAKRE